ISSTDGGWFPFRRSMVPVTRARPRSSTLCFSGSFRYRFVIGLPSNLTGNNLASFGEYLCRKRRWDYLLFGYSHVVPGKRRLCNRRELDDSLPFMATFF